MSYHAAMHKFIIGEVRTDGWKSQWRLDLERRMAEEERNPRPYVKTSKAPRKPVPGSHGRLPRKCEVCGTGIRQGNKSGRCGAHKIFTQPIAKSTCPYTGCMGSLTHRNLYGICKRHYHQFRGLFKQTEVRTCIHPGCFNVLLKNCLLKSCRKHAQPERRLLETLRMRRLRAKAKELRRAA